MPNPESTLHDLVVYFGFLPGVVAIIVVLVTMAVSFKRPVDRQ
jgi:hypothetical protein